MINDHVFDNKSRKEREIDVMTKSGKAKHKIVQYTEQRRMAEAYGRGHIIFSPGSSDKQIFLTRQKGFTITNDINELWDMEAKRK